MTQTAKKVSKPAKRPTKGKSGLVDAHVGQRLRLRRTLLGMSQEKLGEAIGLTFQQVQKYERGVNRIGASRLYQLSQVLDVPVGYFFEEMSGEVAKSAQKHPHGGGFSEETLPSLSPPDPAMRRETLELVRAYYRIDDQATRKRVFELTKAIANMDNEDK